VSADYSRYFIFRNAGAFHHDFVAYHDGRGYRQVQFKVFIGLIGGDGFGCHFYLNRILNAQPGHHALEALSRRSVGFVEEKSHFEHTTFLSSAAALLKLVHSGEHLIGRQKIQQTKILALFAVSIQKYNRWDPLDAIFL
jgi:hypothetical protein